MTIEFPGLVDLQVNGFAGIDFNAPGLSTEQLTMAVGAIRATGVTRFLPTLITSSTERFARCASAIIEVDDPAIAGIHMEGPYISPADGARGAHPRAHTAPASVDDFKRRHDAAAGRIVLVTLAPEVEGALPLIEYLTENGIHVAIGHSEADATAIRDAIRAGATLSTHLGNGCSAMLPRHPNLVWEQLASDDLYASFIVDGHHLPPATVKAMVRAKSPALAILVTDAMAAAACAPGSYRIGELDVVVGADRRVSLSGTPFLAGSALTMPEAIANTVRFTGVALAEALAMGSTGPADYLEIPTSGSVTAEWDAETQTLQITAIRDTGTSPAPPSLSQTPGSR